MDLILICCSAARLCSGPETSEFDLANGFRVVADGHAEEPGIYHTCQTLAEQCEEHVE